MSGSMAGGDRLIPDLPRRWWHKGRRLVDTSEGPVSMPDGYFLFRRRFDFYRVACTDGWQSVDYDSRWKAARAARARRRAKGRPPDVKLPFCTESSPEAG